MDGQLRKNDGLVRVLTALTSFAYQFLRAAGVLALVALPLMRMFGGPAGGFYYGVEVPVAAPTVQATVATAWGPAPLRIDEARGKLSVPIGTAPWPFVGLI